MPKFKIGMLVCTNSVAMTRKENPQFASDVSKCLERYLKCDWGDTCKEDSKMNHDAIKNNNRIVAKYKTCEGDIFIITEWDRSVTTILFPDEY